MTTDKSNLQMNEQIWRELPFIENVTEINELPDLSHIKNLEIRKEIMILIQNYQPSKMKKSPIQLRLTLKDDIPVYQRARRLPQPEKEIVENQIEEWPKEGIIRHSSSDYAVPVVPVPKKDGTKRVCIDYRPIKKKLIRDRYPLPNIDEQIDALQGAKIYSVLDLANGYFHIPMAVDNMNFYVHHLVYQIVQQSFKDTLTKYLLN